MLIVALETHPQIADHAPSSNYRSDLLDLKNNSLCSTLYFNFVFLVVYSTQTLNTVESFSSSLPKRTPSLQFPVRLPQSRKFRK